MKSLNPKLVIKNNNTDEKFNKWVEVEFATVKDLEFAYKAFFKAKCFKHANIIFETMRAKVIATSAKNKKKEKV